jgi:hypothetical protein
MIPVVLLSDERCGRAVSGINNHPFPTFQWLGAETRFIHVQNLQWGLNVQKGNCDRIKVFCHFIRSHLAASVFNSGDVFGVEFRMPVLKTTPPILCARPPVIDAPQSKIGRSLRNLPRSGTSFSALFTSNPLYNPFLFPKGKESIRANQFDFIPMH